MPRPKQAKRTTVKDLRSILRLTYVQDLSVRAISERLQISKTSVATYLLRAREAGLSWPLQPIYESEATLPRPVPAARTAAPGLEGARVAARCAGTKAQRRDADAAVAGIPNGAS